MDTKIQAMNEITRNAVSSVPRFFYYLANYDEDAIYTPAPVHAGDIICVNTGEAGEKSQSRKVSHVEFVEATRDVGTGLYSAFIHFE